MAGVDTVPVLSVDALLDTVFGWDHVDILKLDCEGACATAGTAAHPPPHHVAPFWCIDPSGYDVPAIKSGLGSLSGGKVGVLLFE